MTLPVATGFAGDGHILMGFVPILFPPSSSGRMGCCDVSALPCDLAKQLHDACYAGRTAWAIADETRYRLLKHGGSL